MEEEGNFEGLGRLPYPYRLRVVGSVGSTNDEARKMAEDGEADGLVVLALNQTSGRGRRGAEWFSAPGDSLAFSIMVRPEEPRGIWSRMALAAGVAVAEAMESFGVTAGIKWPNDVWLGKRKAAGILIESCGDFVIVGIGVNINTTAFPEAVADIATSMRMETGRAVERSAVLSAIMGHFARRRCEIGEDFGVLLDAVRARCVLTGQRVALSTTRGRWQGTVEGIAAGGELLVRTAEGLECLMQADEIRLV